MKIVKKRVSVRILLALFLTIIVFVGFGAFSVNNALAVSKCVNNKPKACLDPTPIKLQIGIPGVSTSYSCLADYYNFDKKPKAGMDVKTVTTHCVAGFPQYIRGIYNLFIGVVGLLAVVMIMLGGFKWLLAAGNAQKIAGAKTTIISAIMGLVLALGSYSILSWINPALTELKLQPASITLKDNKNVIGICKKSQKLIPDLDEGEVPECGKLYMLLEQTEPKKEDQFCEGYKPPFNSMSPYICFRDKNGTVTPVRTLNIAAIGGLAVPYSVIARELGGTDPIPDSKCGDMYFFINDDGERTGSAISERCPTGKYCAVDMSKHKIHWHYGRSNWPSELRGWVNVAMFSGAEDCQ